MITLVLAVLHLLALGIGLAAVWTRGRIFSGTIDNYTLRSAFAVDTWWGAAAVLWIVTGLWRLFGATDKATGYYMTNHVFWAKMALLLVIIGLEVWPMVTLLRWRKALSGDSDVRIPEAGTVARGIAAISYAQVALIVGMVIAAAAMARGYGGG
jgi:putative membrane protein